MFPPLFRSRPHPAGSETWLTFNLPMRRKSSRSRFLLKFLQKFSQIIILTSPISRSTLSPLTRAFAFLIFSYSMFWILSSKSHLISFLITLQCYIKSSTEKNRIPAVFSRANFREFVRLLFFNFLFGPLLLLLKRYYQACKNFVSNVYHISLLT